MINSIYTQNIQSNLENTNLTKNSSKQNEVKDCKAFNLI